MKRIFKRLLSGVLRLSLLLSADAFHVQAASSVEGRPIAQSAIDPLLE